MNAEVGVNCAAADKVIGIEVVSLVEDVQLVYAQFEIAVGRLRRVHRGCRPQRMRQEYTNEFVVGLIVQRG